MAAKHGAMKAMPVKNWLPYLGAAFLCADLELTPEPGTDHAAYIQGWLKVVKEDRRAIFSAAAHAQRAADFLHGLQSVAKSKEGAAA